MESGLGTSLHEFDHCERENSDADSLAGLDEAGRGPLAGPVVAAAVLFRKSFLNNPGFLEGLNDSKKITPAKRLVLFSEIAKYALVGIGVASESLIDRINIYQATRIAMRRAVLSLSRSPGLLLIDGNLKLDLPLPQKQIVRGDQKSACIAAASIIAKVYRDAWMEYLDGLYPGYHFSRHKGYATPNHLSCLKALGPSPVHRRSFAPLRTSRPELFESYE